MNPGSRPTTVNDRRRTQIWARTLGVLAFYLFAGWAYVAVVAVFRPVTLSLPVWHDARWLHKDTFGVVCFAGSLLCYFAAKVLGLRRGRVPTDPS